MLLKTWAKSMKDIKNIQKVFDHRAKMNGLSSKAEWSENLEKENSLNKLKNLFI